MIKNRFNLKHLLTLNECEQLGIRYKFDQTKYLLNSSKIWLKQHNRKLGNWGDDFFVTKSVKLYTNSFIRLFY